MAFNLRRLLLGAPLASHALEHETLPKILALPIFSSDALSSVAYATQEMMIALVVAGTAAFSISIWQAGAIVTLLVILTASYNQTIFAYPQGGGAYNVAMDNLGVIYAQVAAVSLMTDYMLTVAVSVASGIDAIISTDPVALDHLWLRLLLCLLSVWFIVLMNLRGITESGRAFAIPVYIFIGSILTLIGIGIWQVVHLGHFAFHNQAVAPEEYVKAIHRQLVPLGLFLILHSFASGCTALTGLEAISNSTSAFRNPKSHNAAVTMRWLAIFLGTMLLGITWLAQRLSSTDRLITWDTGETVISQIAHAAVGGHWFYWCVQISTFAVLILAANTSFTGFPGLSAMVARDGFLPKQLMGRGDRLVYQNGILFLGVVASLLLLIFRGSTDALIPLYAIGVYLAFTLSQAGMVKRWIREKTANWQVKAAMNGIGAVITLVVAIIFGIVKFREGAWVVLILIPAFTFLLHRIGTHYEYVRGRLKPENYRSPDKTRPHIAVVPTPDLSGPVLGAIEYARSISPEVDLLQWAPGRAGAGTESIPGLDFTVDTTSASWIAAIVNRARELRAERNTLVTLVLPENLPIGIWGWLLQGKSDLLVKLALLNERGVVVSDTRGYRMAPGLDSKPATGSHVRHPHTALVLVPGVHQGTLQALDYARRISKDVKTLHIEISPDATAGLREQWEHYVPDIALMVMESPYRLIREPLIRYIRALRVLKPGCIITVVLPEFVARAWWNKLLHNHAGFILKIALRNVAGIVVANPRYFLATDGAPTTEEPVLQADGVR